MRQMFNAGLISFLALAGCAATQAPSPETSPPPAAEGSCRSETLNQFVNQKANEETGRKMLAASGAQTIRWVAPGMAVTMDFRHDRLTVSHDANMMITQASCG